MTNAPLICLICILYIFLGILSCIIYCKIKNTKIDAEDVFLITFLWPLGIVYYLTQFIAICLNLIALFINKITGHND
jgi:hypothetical protein